MAYIKHDVGKHAGPCVLAFPRENPSLPRDASPFFLFFPGDGNSCSKVWPPYTEGWGPLFRLMCSRERPRGSERRARSERSARLFFNIFQHVLFFHLLKKTFFLKIPEKPGLNSGQGPIPNISLDVEPALGGGRPWFMIPIMEEATFGL